MVKKPPSASPLFGRQLREARVRAGLAQDRLGVMIGLDEGCSSARISRYETGIHEPPFGLASRLAAILGVPAAYFYCEDDDLAALLLALFELDADERERALVLVRGLFDERKALGKPA
jgi:transcriptional regulator with XRE-family HTH domain